MKESHITVGVAVASVLIASAHIFLRYFTPKQEEANGEDAIAISMPEFKLTYLYNKVYFLVLSFKRFVYDRPSRGMNAGKAQQQQYLANEKGSSSTKKTIYFIRHGQSVWNHTFDWSRGFFWVLFSTLQLLLVELLFLFNNDSFLYDTPLSMRGINQALEYAKNLSSENTANAEDLKAISGEDSTKSALFTSNLRRAQSTLMLLLQDRLRRTKEKITVLGELEEVVPHPDCVSIYTTFAKSTVPFMEVMMVPDEAKKYSAILRKGNAQEVHNLSMYEKMLSFNERVFKQPEDVIIVCGHSRWIRYYLDIFLPKGSEVEYRHKKIGNVDTIRFDLLRKQTTNSDHFYTVDQNSVKLMYKNTV